MNTTNNIVPAATTGQEQPGGWFGRHFGLRFAALFLTLFTLAWSSAQGTALERLIIEQTTVATSARLIAWIAPGEEVRAEGARLVSTRARLSVLNGCDGTESVLLLVSAVLAFPVAWRRKPVGVLGLRRAPSSSTRCGWWASISSCATGRNGSRRCTATLPLS